MDVKTISRYLFDDDDGIEFIYITYGGGGLWYWMLYDEGAISNTLSVEYGCNAFQTEDGAFLETYGGSADDNFTKKLPGNFPEIDDFLWKVKNFGSPVSNVPDTVYVERFTRDTVYN